eukprot:9080958-Alexandrium_andersonii.AAC.1
MNSKDKAGTKWSLLNIQMNIEEGTVEELWSKIRAATPANQDDWEIIERRIAHLRFGPSAPTALLALWASALTEGLPSGALDAETP